MWLVSLLSTLLLSCALAWVGHRLVARYIRRVSFFKPLKSTCVSCGQTTPWREQIPVVGPLLVKGRCPQCGAAHPWSLLMLQLLLVAIPWVVWGREAGWVWLVGLSGMAILAAIDTEIKRVPRSISYPLLAIGVLNMSRFADPLPVLLWALLAYGSVMLLRLLGRVVMKQEALGMGDVLMAAMMVLWFGPKAGVVGMALGIVLAGVTVGIGWAMGRVKRGDRVALVPFLLGGVWGWGVLEWAFDLVKMKGLF